MEGRLIEVLEILTIEVGISLEKSLMLNIDIYSDVICPWCWIGKRRLETGLALAGRAATVRWHPFELNPDMPTAGVERHEYRIKKFGSIQRSIELDRHVAEAGRGVGLEFNFEKMLHTPNTFDAHRIIWFAGEHGVQDSVVEALFQAYFVDGRNLSDRATLATIASEGGLDQREVNDLLSGEWGKTEVKAGLLKATRLGIRGVPFFVFNSLYAMSGAQAPETFLAAIKRSIPAGAGDSCTFDPTSGKQES